jgi:penicillin-binding protein A
VNKPLRKVAIVGMLLILACLINVNYIQGVEADKLKTNPYNARQYLDRFDHNRGPIMAGSMTLAYSKAAGKKNYQRVYNDGKIFAPVTGVQSVFESSGLEGAENGLLDGTDKRLTIHNWFDQLIGKTARGATVNTTILPKAQITAYDGVANKTLSRGAAVVVDVKTGALKVLASYPSYDTNRLATHDPAVANKVSTELNSASSKPTLDKALDETFAPGSSFKTVDSATAFQGGQFTESTQVNASTLQLPSGHTLVNDEGGSCNSTALPLIDAFAQSCNGAFGRLALDTLGASALNAQATKFGWGKSVQVENGMTSAASIFPADATADNLARAGIGQGDVTATPLQMAMVAQAVANNGVMMKPYLVDKVTAPDESELVAASPQQLGQPISSNTAGMIQDMMRKVVQSGTAQQYIGGSDIAGKTGTAETGNGHNEDWFVGFAPAHNPQIAFAVITEGPTGSTGGEFSAPIAKSIVESVLGR